MRTFKQHLMTEAPQWQRSLFEIITTDYLSQMNWHPGSVIVVPLQNALLKRHFDIRNEVAAHIAGIEQVHELSKIQNKKSRHISATTEPNKSFVMDGIWGGSGAVYLLKGDVLIFGGKDIWSTPTKQGTRVTTLYNINEEEDKSLTYRYLTALDIVMEKSLESNKDNLPDYENELNFRLGTHVTKKLQHVHTYFKAIENGDVPGATRDHKRIVAKIKRDIISAWFDFWNKEFREYNSIWKSRLFGASNSNKFDAAYNEVVLSNFSIEKALVLQRSYDVYTKDNTLPTNLDIEPVEDVDELYNETIRLLSKMND